MRISRFDIKSKLVRHLGALVLLLNCILLLSACSSIKQLGNSILSFSGSEKSGSVKTSVGIDRAIQDLTSEEEYYLGRAVSARILSLYPIYHNAEQTRYLNKIGLILASFSEKPETFGGYHFTILDSDQPNALAAPGGFIFITRGLLQKISDEDTLAAVLAHEIEHVAREHGIKAISQAKLNQALSKLGEVAGALNCAEIVQQATVIFGGAVDDVMVELLEKGYSRDQEREADQGGLRVLERSAYDPYAMVTMLEVLEHEANSAGGWLHTHPGATERKLLVSDDLAKRAVKRQTAGRKERAKRFARVMGHP